MIATKIHEGNTNIRELSVQIPTDKFRKTVRRVSIEQVGLTNEYVVKTTDSSLSYSWSWKDDVITSQKFVSHGSAMELYNILKLEVLALEIKNPSGLRYGDTAPHAATAIERITSRPIGITNPKNPKYIDCNLICIEYKGYQAGRCFYISDSKYSRADGGVLTQDDITALTLRASGQVHRVSAKPGDLHCDIHSEVDSSD